MLPNTAARLFQAAEPGQVLVQCATSVPLLEDGTPLLKLHGTVLLPPPAEGADFAYPAMGPDQSGEAVKVA